MILIKNKEQTHERWNQEQMKIMALNSKELKETTRENVTVVRWRRIVVFFCLGKILLICKLSQFLPISLHISYIPILINHTHILVLVLCLWLEKFSLSHE